MIPSRWRSSSWTPQKQPPARIAVSLLSLMFPPCISMWVVRWRWWSSLAPAAEELRADKEDVEDVEEDPGRDRHGGVGGAAAQAVEVEDREGAEDHEACGGVDDVLVGDRDEEDRKSVV